MHCTPILHILQPTLRHAAHLHVGPRGGREQEEHHAQPGEGLLAGPLSRRCARGNLVMGITKSIN